MKKIGGRPKKENNATKHIGFYVTEQEYQKMEKLFKESAYQSKSQMYRDLILNGKHTVVTTDQTMFQIRNQLLTNVKKVYSQFGELIGYLKDKENYTFSRAELHLLIEICEDIRYCYEEIKDNFKL